MYRLIVRRKPNAVGGNHRPMHAANSAAVGLCIIERPVMHVFGRRLAKVCEIKAPLCIKYDVIGAAQRLTIAALIDRLKRTGHGVNALD